MYKYIYIYICMYIYIYLFTIIIIIIMSYTLVCCRHDCVVIVVDDVVDLMLC